MEDEIINKMFYVITPELVRKFLDLWFKHRINKKYINITQLLMEELDIDENLALYLQAHVNGFDSYFNEDSSTRFHKNKKLDVQENMVDKKGNYLPKFDCETIYIKKSDLVL